MGMSPMDAPATYSLLQVCEINHPRAVQSNSFTESSHIVQYTEIAEGIWYPQGGFHRVVQGLEDIARREGAEIRLNAPVKSVLVEEGAARGVVLESGETLRADMLCINADLVYAYSNLLPKSSYGDRLAQRQSSCSSISFYWGLNTQLPQLGAHNIFLADKYKESFDEIFKLHQMPGEPSFYINVPSRLDNKAAPPGKDVRRSSASYSLIIRLILFAQSVVVLVPVGHMNPSQTPQDFDAMIAKARSHIFGVLKRQLGIENMDTLIAHEEVYDPRSWKDAFNLDKGSILGLSHSFL